MVLKRLRDGARKWCGDEQLLDACQHGVAIGLGRHESVRLALAVTRSYANQGQSDGADVYHGL